MEPYFYATEDSITLYWELPEDSGVYEGYRIWWMGVRQELQTELIMS